MDILRPGPRRTQRSSVRHTVGTPTRVTRTTTSPLGSLALAVRPDRFETDYLI